MACGKRARRRGKANSWLTNWCGFFRLCYEYCAEKKPKGCNKPPRKLPKILDYKTFLRFRFNCMSKCRCSWFDKYHTKNRANKNVIVFEPWKVVSFSHSSINVVCINRSGMIHKILCNFLLFFIFNKSSISDGGCDSKHQNNFMQQQNVGSVINDDRSE